MKLAAWVAAHSWVFWAIGRWIIYFVLYCVIVTALWNIFLSFRGPNGRDDDD